MRPRWIGLFTLLIGCGASLPLVHLPGQAPPRDEVALAAAAEAFYVSDLPGMRQAVDAARIAGPDTAIYHELAARMAWFEADQDRRFEHLLAALSLDPSDDAASQHLWHLREGAWTLDQRRRAEAAVGALAVEHPAAGVRGLAAALLASMRHHRGNLEGMRQALAGAGLELPLAVIGPFDNDQGKGFDHEQPPEREIDLSASYPGKLRNVAWRTEVIRDPRGWLPLGQLISPARWAIAFGAAALDVRIEGDYELRLSSSGPFKVWVNQVPVAIGRRARTWRLDAYVIPIRLRAGVNQVLLKLAQETGTWRVRLRLTGPGGAPLPQGALAGLVSPDTPFVEEPLVEGSPSQTLRPLADLLDDRVAGLAPGARRDTLRITWALDVGDQIDAVQRAETFVAAHPSGLIGRYLLARALWNNQERGRTADLLNALVHETGLPMLKLKQARFWQQQRLKEKARALLVATRDAFPNRYVVWRDLASLFESEKWHEDRCATLEVLNRRWPSRPSTLADLADCYESLRFYPRSFAIYRRIVEALPNDRQALRSLQWQAQGNDDYETAERYALRLTRAFPHERTPWMRLAETRRRKGDPAGARAALRQATLISPDAAAPFKKRAELAYQQGSRDLAIEAWRAALERDPDDEGVANRLDFLAPEARGPWAEDVPDEDQIAQAIAARGRLQIAPGANVIYLLDDEVTELRGDGSTVQVITMVAHAVNESGRDRLLKMKIRGGGRSRLMHAFAVDPQGSRQEASSIRGSTVRYRQLEVGSTVVLQYRLDAPPDGYLAGNLARNWWFQGPNTQTRRARWVLWTPKGTQISESLIGPVRRAERTEGAQVRVEWSAHDTPPVIAEPKMPNLSETAARVAVSTVPGWSTFWKWEEALLRDAFRESPQVQAVAKRIFAGVEDPAEKIRRIQAYVMTDIRYQQDYEGRIAGVKPHTAPVVVARRYGDCKDKAVLFITLARLAGLRVHFALVRTRTAGPVLREVPMQQFNHAIVYVPAQEGLGEGRFYDPTVDALDVDVLRQDDQGTWSMVFDPIAQAHQWRFIDLQAPEVDDSLVEMVLRLQAAGGVRGEMTLTARGQMGSFFRKLGRDRERLGQILERQLGNTFPGGRLLGYEAVQVTNVHQPARVQLSIEAPNVARLEGDDLRLSVPFGWSPQPYFQLAKRQYPLLLGVPRTRRWQVELVLPAGVKVKRLPDSARIESPCLAFSRTYEGRGEKVIVRQRIQVRCERISAADYPAHRAQAEKMLRVIDEQIVLSLPGTARRKTSSL